MNIKKEKKDITMVQGVVLDEAPIFDVDTWLIGQIFVSSNPYVGDESVVYIGKSAFVFNKVDYPELWEIYKDDPLLDTGRVPMVQDLNKKDRYYVKVKYNKSIIEGGL